MCTGKMKNSCYQQVYVRIPSVASILINFLVQDRDTKPMVCLSCVNGSWCCTFKKHYAVLASNSRIRNFELQSQCTYMVYGQYVVLIDMGLSDSTSLYTLTSNQYGIQKLAVLMAILKPNLLKNCFTCSLSHPAVCTCLDRSLLVHKSQHGLLCLCLARNFH